MEKKSRMGPQIEAPRVEKPKPDMAFGIYKTTFSPFYRRLQTTAVVILQARSSMTYSSPSTPIA